VWTWSSRWIAGISVWAWSVVGLAQAPAAPAPAAASTPTAILPLAAKKLSPEREARIRATVGQTLGELGLFALAPEDEVRKVVDRLARDKIYRESCLEQVSCARRVGARLKATWLFHVAAAQSLGGVTLTVRAFDGRTGELLRRAARFAGEGPGELERAVVQATRLAAGPVLAASQPGKGRLALEAEPADVEIVVNGAPCLTCDAPGGAEFASGALEVVVQRADYLPFGEVVLLRPGQVARLQVALELTPEGRQRLEVEEARRAALARLAEARAGVEPERPPPPPPPPEETAFYETWWFWTVVGAVVAGGVGVGLYFGLQEEGPTGAGTLQVGWE